MNDYSVEQMAEAFRRVLGEDETGNRAILVKRIPIICQDILQIKADMTWIKYLVMGVAGCIGTLAMAYIMKS